MTNEPTPLHPEHRSGSRFLLALALLVLLILGAAGSMASQHTDDPVAAQVGALLLPRVSGTFLADDDPELLRLQQLIRERKIGGAVFFAGDPLSVASTVERLRAVAPEDHQLLFGLDAEWGAAMRLDGATQWPRAMALGATANPSLVYEMGRNTAQEARVLGIDLVLAPVADLALRADNGVIGNRSFGGSPGRVASLVAAFVRGVQSTGALAVVKHFPGHGATDEDSHATLPVLEVGAERLRQRELVPFRAAIRAGVAAVMPGHLALPAIDPSGAPASLSPVLLQNWLREELGFDGLIVSDALDMRGARALTWDGRVSAQALSAGVDLLLLPTHVEAAHAEILRAIERGEVSRDRIADAAARRESALASTQAQDARRTAADLGTSATSTVGSDAHGHLVRQAASEAITLYPARDREEPPDALASWSPPRILLLELDHHPQRRSLLPLRRALARRTTLDWIRMAPLPPGATYLASQTLAATSSQAPLEELEPEDGELAVLDEAPELDQAAELDEAPAVRPAAPAAPNATPSLGLDGPLSAYAGRIAAADVVLVALQRGGASWCADARCERLRPSAQPLVDDLETVQQSGKIVHLLTFADPWPLLADDFARWSGYAAHDGSPASQEALAAALFGETEITGTPPLFSDTEITTRPQLPTSRLRRAPPSAVGMSAPGLEKAADILRRAVDDGTTPGAVALVARRGAIVFAEAFGRVAERDHLPEGLLPEADGQAPAVTLDTVYGLASLTKVVATTTLAMRLVEAGRLELDRKVVDYVPEYLVAAGADDRERELRSQITVRHLLTHSSGILWWTDLHLRHGVQSGNSPAQARRAYLEEIFALPLESRPGKEVAYSDLGILLLGEILERVGGAPFAELVRREVLQPLAMTATTFAPDERLRQRVAPTEYDPWRDRVVWGEVHDENAAGLGGIAPHAGLFSTVSDLAKFAQMMLSGGIAEGSRYLNGRTIDRFTTRADDLPDDATRALGWDTPGARSSGGRYLSDRAFGHTGFVGTSLWIDPEHELFVVLLTNRVHPTREDIRIRELRPSFHDAVMRSIVDRTISARPGSEPR